MLQKNERDFKIRRHGREYAAPIGKKQYAAQPPMRIRFPKLGDAIEHRPEIRSPAAHDRQIADVLIKLIHIGDQIVAPDAHVALQDPQAEPAEEQIVPGDDIAGQRQKCCVSPRTQEPDVSMAITSESSFFSSRYSIGSISGTFP